MIKKEKIETDHKTTLQKLYLYEFQIIINTYANNNKYR